MNDSTTELLTVVFFGKTGAGKSSTLNALFNLNCNTDAAVACTKEPQEFILSRSQYSFLPIEQVRVVDMPGIAESREADEKYLPFYEKWMPLTHSLTWVTQADTRAYKRDQLFLMKLLPLFHPHLTLTIALNKVDCLSVDETESGFDTVLKQPSSAQLKILPEKVDDVYSVFADIIGDTLSFQKSDIVPYTAFYGWGFEDLLNKILTGVK